MRGGRGGYRGPRQAGAAHLRSQIVAGGMTNSVRRLQKDYKELRDAVVPLVGVSAAPTEDNFFVWRANLRGPEASAFYGGVFHIEITFPQNYPVSPPSIRTMTDIPHPNVFGRTLCLDMLQPKKKDSGWYDGWSSAYTVESILIQLQSFLFEVPRRLREAEQAKIQDDASVSDWGADERNKYKKAVDQANEFKCDVTRHRGPIEPWPPFNEREADEAAFVIVRDPKVMLGEEFLCYHSRCRLPEVSLGIGVSLSRLPRTGEIRSVTPTLDLLSLRAFTKQKVRRSIDNERFTHWLPLYFGESEPYEITDQRFDEESKAHVQTTRRVDPRERLITLLKHSLCFLAKGSTTKELTAEIVLEILPKLIITHVADMCTERKHVSILALRRLVNFLRLFRLCIELVPGVSDAINEKLREFKEEEAKRVKDFAPSLGDILAISMVSNEYSLPDILDAYLEEQLDRQAFWILRIVPELDHTDDKYKNRQVTLEAAREEVCFKSGLAGFSITMFFYSLTQTLRQCYAGDWAAFEAGVDGNFGCLPLEVEDQLQVSLKKILRVDSFQKYYQWIGQECPDSEALGQRLHKAITNSKAKRYHGSSEHMNELPPLADQIKEHLMAEPSPFAHYDEASKTFVDGANPVWKQLCMKKFDWVRRVVEQGIKEATPAGLAARGDKHEMDGVHERSLQQYILDTQFGEFGVDTVRSERVYDDYTAAFTWRDLYHKLCFEQMLANFDKLLDFGVFYDYVNKLGDSVQVLRVRTLNKTKLKSNHYWIMVLMTKLTKLRVVKIHGSSNAYVGPDFYKFLLKGMNYMAKDGRQLQKIELNALLGVSSSSGDYLYPCLKPHQNLVSLDFSNQVISTEDAKAIGKVLADFRQVRELNLTNANLNTTTTKEIADGLMRAKQLEVLILHRNPAMSAKVSTIIYNLAFSPKIRHIDISELGASNADTAEALFKLIKISGAIETLNLRNTGVEQHLTQDFWKALGENQTLKYLNLDTGKAVTSDATYGGLGKAVAMNAYRNGILEALSLVGWFANCTRFQTFVRSLYVSNKDHEEWYGDRKTASEMEKDDLERKMHFNLKFFNVRASKLNGICANYKQILKQARPDWPKMLELVTKSPMILNFKKVGLRAKDVETIAYMLAENPYGASQITSMTLQQNDLCKEGAKTLAPALKANTSLVTLNLSSCKIGVSGMVNICDALATNSTLQNLSLYRNVFDVDGARALGTMLKTNTSLKFLDVGHNRIRLTGLKSITEGILANPASRVSEMSVKANFITDEGFTYLFEQLVLPKEGRAVQLQKVWIKNNFLSEFHKIELSKRLVGANLVGQVYVDDFEGINLLSKEFSDRSIWIAPMPKSYLAASSRSAIAHFFQESHECGFVIDVRLGHGGAVKGRTKENVYCIVEYAHENSIPRSLKVASKKLARFGGQPVRIYKAGTKTAVNMPSQRRRGL